MEKRLGRSGTWWLIKFPLQWVIGEGCSFGRTSGVVWHLCVLHVATSKNILVKDVWSIDFGGGVVVLGRAEVVVVGTFCS